MADVTHDDPAVPMEEEQQQQQQSTATEHAVVDSATATATTSASASASATTTAAATVYTVVWAKVERFPWWPCIVVDEADITNFTGVLAAKKPDQVPILYLPVKKCSLYVVPAAAVENVRTPAHQPGFAASVALLNSSVAGPSLTALPLSLPRMSMRTSTRPPSRRLRSRSATAKPKSCSTLLPTCGPS